MLAKNFKKSLLAVNIGLAMTAGYTGVAIAADQDVQAKENVEVIEVRGIRASNKANVNIKRFTNSIVDAVTAEDIGKLPDSDVGQALARIPGVSVNRTFGQGSSVSIRGTDPRMTLTTLNGQNVASTGWYDQMNIDRSFNYSMLPPELIGEMQVYKTSQANIVEGGIGGTVIVKTRKPLDLDQNTFFGSLKAEYGTVNENVAPDVSALYSWKNDDENFGILVSGAFVDREYLRRGTESDLDWGGRSSIQPSSFLQEQERSAFNVALQYRPSENLELGASLLSLKLGADSIGANMYINTDTDWGDGESNCLKKNDAGVCVYSVTPEERASRVFFQNWARQGEMTSDTFELNAKYEGDGFTIKAVAGSTSAEGGTEMTANFGFGWWGDRFNAIKWAGTVNAQDKQIEIFGRDMGFTVDQLDSTASTSTWTGTKGPNKDEETYAQIDLEFDVELGLINKLYTGIRTTEHEFTKKEYRAVYNPDLANSFDTSDLYSGTMELGTAGYVIPKANLDAMINATLSLVDEFVYSRPAYGKITEDNLSAYLMAEFQGDGVRGNFGVRYVSTDVTSAGHTIDNSPADNLALNFGWSEGVVTEKGSYSDVLPSANITFDLTEDLQLKFSAAQAITRPNYDTLFLTAISGYPDDRQGNEQITKGNPNLEPMKSSQADIGLNYFYGDGNMFSVTYFMKDVSNFIVGTTKANQSVGVPNTDLDDNADNWTLNGYQNAGGGTIDGIEFELNHAFENGFGINANYTFTDAGAPAEVYTDRLGQFSESSRDTVNLVGYWENETFSARAAYNWRSKYMIREYGLYYGNRMHDDFGTLDLSFGWEATDYMSVRLEVVNLLEEDDVQYGAASGTDSEVQVKPALQDGYPTWSFIGETTYKLGVNFRF